MNSLVFNGIPKFFNGDFQFKTNFITFWKIQWKSNENVMENQNKCSNSIKNEIGFDWTTYICHVLYCLFHLAKKKSCFCTLRQKTEFRPFFLIKHNKNVTLLHLTKWKMSFNQKLFYYCKKWASMDLLYVILFRI